MFNNKAQGSLEYLIIVAAVLAIGAIVILFLTQAGNAGNKQALVSQCKNAASSCASTIMSTGVTPCADSICAACNPGVNPQLTTALNTTLTCVNDDMTNVYASGAGTPLVACKAGKPQCITQR